MADDKISDDVLDFTPPKPEKPGPNTDPNPLGGKNPQGLYVPISEDEQEVLARLVETQDLKVIIHGWGVLENPKMIFGDLRISIPMTLEFDSPVVPVDVFFLDLELQTGAGETLIKQRQPVMYDGKPVQVAAGVVWEMAWDIALDHMNPALVKSIKPGAIGLTSRRLDKDTKERTPEGNMKLDPHQKKLVEHLEKFGTKSRADDVKQRVKATRMSGDEVKMTDKGPEAPDVK